MTTVLYRPIPMDAPNNKAENIVIKSGDIKKIVVASTSDSVAILVKSAEDSKEMMSPARRTVCTGSFDTRNYVNALHVKLDNLETRPEDRGSGRVPTDKRGETIDAEARYDLYTIRSNSTLGKTPTHILTPHRGQLETRIHLEGHYERTICHGTKSVRLLIVGSTAQQLKGFRT